MFAHLPYSGLGPLASFGLGLIIATEVSLRAITKDPTITAPHSWWLMCGYVVAAIYCILLDCYLKRRETRLGYDSPGEDHKLGGMRIWHWSILYVILGLIRMTASA
jgi:hypothetical protein